jgi:hypothetical protein
VVFARGTVEPPGLGITGTAFVGSLRLQAGGKSVAAYAVDYPASGDFGNRLRLARTVLDGVADAQTHVEFTAANCPRTRIVLGGYSQGAVVASFATSAGTPADIPVEYAESIPAPMPPRVADHVAAVVLFAKPSDRWLRGVGAPAIAIGPPYAGKTIGLCIPGDTICDGAGTGPPNALHSLYAFNGMAFSGAGFAASRL